MANYLFAPKGIRPLVLRWRAFWSFYTKMPNFICELAERGERGFLYFFFLSSSRTSSPELSWRRPAAGVLAAAF